MLKRDYSYLLKHPVAQQSGSQHGVYKGIVVNNKDSFQLGRIQVYCYGLHGDMKNLSIEDLPWCEVIMTDRGAFSVPEINDRVVVSFEAGDKYAPIVIGYWYAVPMGRGNMPYSSPTGTEVRPEAWHHHGLYPESNILACSGAGNAFWFEDKLLGDNLASAIHMEDTGGKIIRARSFHLDCTGFASVQEYDGKKGGMLKGGGEPNQPVRDGLSTPPPASGSIEIATHNVIRALKTGESDFSVDYMMQVDSEGGAGIVQENINGAIHRTRQGRASVTIVGDSVSHQSRANMLFSLLSPPRIW